MLPPRHLHKNALIAPSASHSRLPIAVFPTPSEPIVMFSLSGPAGCCSEPGVGSGIRGVLGCCFRLHLPDFIIGLPHSLQSPFLHPLCVLHPFCLLRPSPPNLPPLPQCGSGHAEGHGLSPFPPGNSTAHPLTLPRPRLIWRSQTRHVRDLFISTSETCMSS